MADWTHLDEEGKARMVDVGEKTPSRRRAIALGTVRLGAKAFRGLAENRLAKGDALGVSRLAGIQAAKRTADWIPLCHSVPLDGVDLSFELREDQSAVDVTATAAATWVTGVEMEALVAVSAACLAIYDMAKAVDRGIVISEVKLIEKSGGRSGHWRCGDAQGPTDSESQRK